MKFKLKDVVRDMLFEEEEKPKDEPKEKPKETPKKGEADIEASTGSGRYAAGVKEAGALAQEDPKLLMKNLGIKATAGSNDIDKILSLLKQALTGADAMKTVYTGLSTIQSGKKSGLKIQVSVIKANSGVKFIYHALVGARNAGILKIDSKIQVENSSGTIIIYQGEKRTWDK
jgi:hypothetical protein